MEKQWYVVNTYSGHENKVKEKLEMRASSMGMEDYIYRVVVPAQKEVVVKNGKEVEKESKINNRENIKVGEIYVKNYINYFRCICGCTNIVFISFDHINNLGSNKF